VRYAGPEGTATGERAAFEGAGTSILLTGSADTLPEITSTEHRVTAEQITVDRASGELAADGDVRTASTTGGAGAGLFEEGSLVYGMCRHLRARQSEGLVVYHGAARLWQGEKLLQADRVEIHRATGELRAVGRVVTRTFSAREGDEEQGFQPLQGSADQFQYQDDNRFAVYLGGARLEMGPDQITGDRIAVSFDEEREVQRLLADGDVRLQSPGRAGSGDRLDYRLAEEIAILYGGDRLAEAQDTTSQRLVRGRTLTFHLVDATIDVESAAGGRTWITLSSDEGTEPLETTAGH
jgi:lipopolysaccharide export system protein LptA